jgi:hypothetical protein
VPAATVAHALPYVNWIVLVALAFGGFTFVAITGHTTDATRGYLGTTAIFAALLAALALAADLGLPAPTNLVTHAATPELDLVRRVGLAGFVFVAVLYVFSLRTRWRLHVSAGAVALGALALLATAVGWAPTIVDSVPFAVQLGILSAVTGGSMAAIVLGHWYLVTPKLSERPLLVQTRLLLWLVVVQGLLFVVWATLGGGVGQGPWDALSGSSVLIVWLRGLITIGFPLVLIYMALRTAQTRSMESATGLLYINLAAVLAGTIGAAALYLSSGTLV